MYAPNPKFRSARFAGLALLAMLLHISASSPAMAQTVLWTWGENFYGELGNGSVDHECIPGKALNLSSVTSISGGFYHTLALKSDGTVWACGLNDYGEVGDGTVLNRDTLVQVASGFTAVAAGGEHSVALKNDGTVWAWGLNGSGEVGDGTNTTRTKPVQVAGLSGVVAIGAGAYHSLALKSDGTVWAWGYNGSGQLGDGTTKSRNKPVQVLNLTGISKIACKGNGHSLALRKSDGTVWAWGDNTYGELGDGTNTSRSTPVQVIGLQNIQAIASGGNHSLALTSTATVWAWGENDLGELGDGTYTNRNKPVQTSGLTDVSAIIARNTHSLAVMKSDGSLRAWGENSSGELGDGTLINRNKPVAVIGLTGVAAIECGAHHSLAVAPDGSLWTWGDNGNGQLGQGFFGDSNFPTSVDGVEGVQAIACGGWHSLAAVQSGAVWAWGHNNDGQLGDGTTTDRATPVQVVGLTGVQAVSAGGSYSVALKSADGSVWAWGINNTGQLGDGTTTTRKKPVQVLSLSGMTAIASYDDGHSLALKKSDGTVWGWGYNGNGELGDGTTTNRTSPVQASGLTGMSAIACGGGHSLAVKGADGTVWAWGYNSDGQLGDGTTTNRSKPVQVQNIQSVTAVACGEKHSLALKSDGTVWAWGHNYDGEIGDGTTTNRGKPVQVVGLTNVIAIAAGDWHSLALKSDGTVWAWGYNPDGELGDSSNFNSAKPVQVTGLANIKLIAACAFHSLAVEKSGVTTSVAVSASSASVGASVTFKATLKRADTSAAIGSETILFTVDGAAAGYATTNSQGIAQLTYTVLESLLPGSHNLQADFGGDNSYGASQASVALAVSKGAVQVAVANVSGSAGAKISLQATLKNKLGAALAGRTLTFSVGGSSAGSATTNAQGQASLTYTIPSGTASGAKTIQVKFAGDSLYNSGSGSGTLTVQ
jgi:alpha-tubulin suppressor-like RCC1 family protein